MTNADDYIKSVLRHLPRGPMRPQIAMELRGNIADRVENGASLSDVFKQLGEPQTLAESYLDALSLAPATFGERVAAKLTDIVVVILAALPVLVIAGRTLPEEAAIFVVVAVLIVASVGFGLYTIGAEYWMGQTLGKHVIGLRVVRESGAPIGLGQAIVRQLPMFMQIYWIDVLFALFTDKKQRAFEVLSKTRVVKADSFDDGERTGAIDSNQNGAA